MNTLAETERGVPSGPQHPGTTSLVTPVADKGERVGEGGAEDGWREVRSNGERDLSSGEADEGGGEEERSAAHMLPFTVLVCSVNPGFCCFPQSAGVQTPSQEARQSLP